MISNKDVKVTHKHIILQLIMHIIMELIMHIIMHCFDS